jgi:ubiquinone/menaquinone biosynthesis C-methylase UbiE
VLDVGCGDGAIARPLAPLVGRLDAVDSAAEMVRAGRILPGGDRANLTWTVGPAESAPVSPPYTLVTAGASIHWFDWEVTLPRFATFLAPAGWLAIVDQAIRPNPWDADLQLVIDRYSTNRDYRPYNVFDELTTRGFFTAAGTWATDPISFRQPVAGYVESFHARNGFSRDRMTPAEAAAFDAAVAEAVSRHVTDGEVVLQIAGTVTWGKPIAPSGPGPGIA